MSQEDYNTIMSVLSENLAETAEETAPVQPTPTVQPASITSTVPETKSHIKSGKSESK